MYAAHAKMASRKGSRDRVSARRTTPVDVQVGRNVRKRRIELGLSQTELAEVCGITFQQVQKYENGANRVSASRLWQFAAVLGLDVGGFFDGLGKPSVRGTPPLPDARTRKIDDETAKIARRIAALKDSKLRGRIKAMLGAMAAGQ
jgi:transcriptional regulator with XRE-family HTH domain